MHLDLLYQMPGHLIRRAHQISGAIFSDSLAGLDLTSVQFAAMVAIGEHPGVDATRVAEMVAFDRGTLGGVIDRLEAKGLVKRRPSAADRRVKTLTLSPAGVALLQEVEAKVVRAQERMLEPLSKAEGRQLTTLLTKLVRLHTAPAPDSGEGEL
jgi:DNA-binding MarR family transcriptional regulator